jgi:hypothetical protein
MADSYIYALPQSTTPTLSDFTVVDTYVSAVSGFVTGRAPLLTLAKAISSSISHSLTSQQPIAQWTTSFETTSSLSAGWTKSATVVQSTSSSWNDVVVSVVNASGDWDAAADTTNLLNTDYQSNSGNWQSTYTTVSAFSASWSSGLLDTYTLSTLAADALTATNECILFMADGQPRAIKLWQY